MNTNTRSTLFEILNLQTNERESNRTSLPSLVTGHRSRLDKEERDQIGRGQGLSREGDVSMGFLFVSIEIFFFVIVMVDRLGSVGSGWLLDCS
jgi:hypothetical protein